MNLGENIVNDNVYLLETLSSIDIKKFSDFILNEFIKSNKEELIIVNIGTDRIIGDSYGPFLGSYLKERNCRFRIYGTLEDTITNKNMIEKIEYIKIKHPKAFFLAIDSSVSNEKMVDVISVSNGSISPGSFKGVSLINIGDASITYNFCIADDVVITRLRNIKLSKVYEVVKATYEIISNLEKDIYSKVK